MKWFLEKKDKILLALFLAMEVILYGQILTAEGKLLIWSEYISVLLCFLFVLISFQKPLLIGGLALTLCADFCLVVCDPIQQLWGMVFFLGAQCLYAVLLHRQKLPRGLLALRIGLSVAVGGVTAVILGKNTDALALVSMVYYVNLIMNLVCAFWRFRKNSLLALGFVLFILCDTVIGLQVAAGAYLPISEDSFIHSLIFSDFHLSWFFYLPSQVFIALSGRRK